VDGSLWLRGDDSGDSVTYTVLDAEGHFRAAVLATRSTRLLWVSGDLAWGEELAQDDVPTLVRYHVEAPRR
jgi:hypothetical protein